MNLKTCDNCRRLFDSQFGSFICPDCLLKTEDTFKKVREYIRNNPNATLFQVAMDCGVEISQLKSWIGEKRIEYREE